MEVKTQFNIGQQVYLLHDSGPAVGVVQGVTIGVSVFRGEADRPDIVYSILLDDGMGSREQITRGQGTYMFGSVVDLLAEITAFFKGKGGGR
jgi:hypothetical protein